MKITRLSIVAIMLIMIVVITAGCSSKPAVGSVVNSSSVISTNYKWITYQSTAQNDLVGNTSGTIRIDKSSDNYQGIPATLIKLADTSSYVGEYTGQTFVTQTAYNIYFDTAMKNVLGGTKSTSKSTSMSDSNRKLARIPHAIMTGTSNQDQPLNYPISAGPSSDLTTSLGGLGLIIGDVPLTYEGTQSVTVPAGTYSNADFYMSLVNGVTTSFWVSSGIPVKIQATTETLVLTGWG